MIDTIVLYQQGKNNSAFELNEKHFKRNSNEQNETQFLYNTFYNENGKQPIYVMNDLSRNFSRIQFSVPKLLYGNSLENVKLEHTEKLEGILQNRLNGIYETDFMNNMTISRLDITQNIETQNEVPVYVHALNEAYSKQGRYRVEKFANESLVIKNNSRRFTMYDKLKEAIANKDITRQEAKAYGNILRYEVQHSKAKNIQTSFHNKKPYTLTEIFTEGFFANAKQFQVNSFDMLFSNAGNYEMFVNDFAILDIVNSYSKKNVLKNFAIKKLTDDYKHEHDFQHYENLLKMLGFTPRGTRKAIQELQRVVLLAKTKQTDVLNEIRMKLAG